MPTLRMKSTSGLTLVVCSEVLFDVLYHIPSGICFLIVLKFYTGMRFASLKLTSCTSLTGFFCPLGASHHSSRLSLSRLRVYSSAYKLIAVVVSAPRKDLLLVLVPSHLPFRPLVLLFGWRFSALLTMSSLRHYSIP